MDDNRVLPLRPVGDDDAELASRVRASFERVPQASAEQVEACVQYVLSEASRQPRRTFWDTVQRNRWWWGGAAAAALLVVLTFRPVRLDDGSRATIDSTTSVLPTGSTTVVDNGTAIRFELRLPAEVRQVALVGDFNGWDSDSTVMRRSSADGTWSTKVPLGPGVHNYAFVVDGQRWLVDPMAPQVPDRGFGPANAVVVVGSR